MRHLITTKDFNKVEIMELFKEASDFLDEKPKLFLKEKVSRQFFLKTLHAPFHLLKALQED